MCGAGLDSRIEHVVREGNKSKLNLYSNLVHGASTTNEVGLSGNVKNRFYLFTLRIGAR